MPGATGTSDQCVNILRDLIAIPTYESTEKAVDYLAQRFEQRKIPHYISHLDGRKFNLAAWVGADPPWPFAGPTGAGPGNAKPGVPGACHKILIFNSHIDTVPPGSHGWTRNPLAPRVEGEATSGAPIGARLYGLGACDAKASLAAMVSAIEDISREIARGRLHLTGTLTLTAVSGEEEGGTGTRGLITEGLSGTAAIVGEPTMLVPRIAHKGVLRCHIDVKGKSAHASSPSLGVNAISKMAHVIAAIDDLAGRVKSHRDEFTGNASLAVTMVEGGRALNVIPDNCRIAIDRRLVPGESEDEAMDEITAAIAALRENDPALNTNISKIRFIPPARIDPGHEIVSLLHKTTQRIAGASPGLGGFTATCDMTFLVNQAGIPTVIFGPGDLSMAHHADEYVDLNQVRLAAEVYKWTALEYLSGRS